MWLLLALSACDTTETNAVYECSVALIALTPAVAVPGEQVLLQARPLSTLPDSALWMGGEQLALDAIERVDCEACDTCRADSGCFACGQDCDTCDLDCLPCVETVSFTVPELDAGSYRMQLFNKYGVSESTLSLQISESVDTGGGDDTAGD